MNNSLAIVGIGCRFPGGITSPDKFWQLLCNKTDAISEIPTERWSYKHFYSSDAGQSGKMITRWGGFIENIDKFDPQFFRISPREATEMDPQQRLLLEVAWEAMEHAGIPPTQLRGSRTGVYIGACSTDYFKLRAKLEIRDTFDGYTYTGGRPSLLAGRVAYTFDFQGPTLVVDTACSSSLVALNLACQALNHGEADAALVGGVNVLLDPGIFILASKLGTQSPAGRCKTFDEGADGFVRAEGCGILLVKRLEDALQDGSRILAVVRGSGVNQDGSSSSITAPDAQAQVTLMHQVLADTHTKPTDITYVEAHGTGTPVGDPVEFSSIWEVFGKSHQSNGSELFVGSVKTNIGHCEAASGIASVIKTVLALQHSAIPANLHFHRLNPVIPEDTARMTVPTEMIPWHTSGQKRYAAINSFGFSGTNAHVLLEEAEPNPIAETPDTQPAHYLLCLSATTPQALLDQAERYRNYLSTCGDSTSAICATANTRRTHFRYRYGVTGGTVQQLSHNLSVFLADKNSLKTQIAIADTPPKIAFLFTGQGSQYLNMGQDLFASNVTFRETLETCDRLLQPHLKISLLELIYPSNGQESESLLQQTAFAQPAIFALEYALYETWKAWGITPDWVMGHSVGEYVAACVSGLFTLEQALLLIATRGRLMQNLPAGGGMVAIATDLETIEVLLGQTLPPTISVAALNAPNQTVLSGKSDVLDEISQTLETRGIKVRSLPVSHAFHSALLEPILEPLGKAFEQIEFGQLRIPLVSNLTGKQVDTDTIAQVSYWLAHTRQAVQFSTSIETLAKEGIQLFLELGPRPTLTSLGQYCLPDAAANWLTSMRPGFNDSQIMMESLAQLYNHGAVVDFSAVYPAISFPLTDLPTYPFQHKRYWSEFAYPHSRALDQLTNGSQVEPSQVHPLLGSQQQVGFSGQLYFQADISGQVPNYLTDHRVNDAVIFPGAAYVEMALAAGQVVSPQRPFAVTNLHLKVAMPLSLTSPRRVQMLLNQREQKLEFEIVSTDLSTDAPALDWIRHVAGEISYAGQSPQVSPNLEDLRGRFSDKVDRQAFYGEMERTGLTYGPSFQSLQELWITESQTEALGRMQLPTAIQSATVDYFLHPVLLDGCSQIARWADGSRMHTVSKVPFYYERIEVYGKAGNEIWCYARRSATAQVGDRNPPVDLFLYAPSGAPMATIWGLYRYTFDRLTTGKTPKPQILSRDAYQTSWHSQPLSLPEANWTDESQVLDGLTILLLPESESLWANTVAAFIEQNAQVTVRVVLGSAFKALSTYRYQVSVESRTDFQTLFQQLEASSLPPSKRIIHLGLLTQTGRLTRAIASPIALTTQVTNSCASTLHLVQALAQREQPSPCELWLITGGSQRPIVDRPIAFDLSGAPLWGLGRVIRSEHPELRCRQVDLDPFRQVGSGEILLAELQQNTGEEEVAYCNGQRWVPRLGRFTFDNASQSELTCPDTESFRLDIGTRGLLNTLSLVPHERRASQAGEVEVEVVAAGLNFRDVLNALGTYKGKQGPLGGEFAGRVVRVGASVDPAWVGKRVLGLATGSFSRYVIANHQVMAELPACLSFEQAAAIPITFLTAYHTLYLIGQIKAGDRVLIHAGAGGVGLAAIQLAQRVGAEVFATAGSDEKRSLLRTLGVPHVMNSRTTDFAEEISLITSGEGIDLVLNSLTGDFITKGLSLLRPGGKFIELGKAELWSETQLATVNPDVTYVPYYLGDYRDNEPTLVQSMFQALLELFARGELEVLYRAFPVQKSTAVFRLMQRGGHVGKLVLTCRQLQPLGQIDPGGTYLLTGGLGGIGLQLSQRLAERGARHLALLSRRGKAQLSDGSKPAEKTNAAIQQLEQQGVQVEILKADVASQEDLSQAIEKIRATMPPLRGIFHAAGVLEDGLLLGQDWSRFQRGLAAKVQGTWNLHTLTRSDELDCFVMFSSVTAVLGPAARGPYAAGNIFLDSMAHYRHQLGLPSLSVNWGAWANTGMAKAIRSQRANLQRLQMLTPDVGLDGLELLITQDVHQIGIFPLDWQEFQKRFSGDQVPRYFQDLVAETLQSSQIDAQGLAGSLDLPVAEQSLPTNRQPALQPLTLRQILATVPLPQRATTLQVELVKGISKLLGLENVAELESEQPLELYGLDSLMMVELRNWFLKELQIEVPVVKLSKTVTVIELSQLLLKSLPEELPKPSVDMAPPVPSTWDGVGSTTGTTTSVVSTNPPMVPSRVHITLKQTLATVPSKEQNLFLRQSLIDNISKMLGMGIPTELEANQPLEIYGLDSLMMVELRNWLLKELSVELPVVKLVKSITISDLTRLLLEAMPNLDSANTVTRKFSDAESKTDSPETDVAIASAEAKSITKATSGKGKTAVKTMPQPELVKKDKFSFILGLKELIYERDDADLTTVEQFTRQCIRSISGIGTMEEIIQDYCSQKKPNEMLQQSCMRRLNLKLNFNEAGLSQIPESGPTVVVANHPFGFIDGVIAEYLVSQRRSDFKILAAPFSKVNRFPEREKYILRLNVQSLLREEITEADVDTMNKAIEYVQQGGALIIFPSGMVSLSRNWLGSSAADREWKPFVSQVVVKGQATVVPIYFEGQNSRLFQLATKLGGLTAFSALIAREQICKVGSQITFCIGSQIPYASLQHVGNYKVLARYLQFVTYDLQRELPHCQ